jgi:hypothetical protein
VETSFAKVRKLTKLSGMYLFRKQISQKGFPMFPWLVKTSIQPVKVYEDFAKGPHKEAFANMVNLRSLVAMGRLRGA